jgi:type II secretory pathway predicted ATPase ExeA/transcriptional regulator with XRE-family HTH domain
MALRLKPILAEHGIAYRQLAEGVGVSKAAISQIVNHDLWPKGARKALAVKILEYLDRATGRRWDADVFEVADEGRTPRPPVPNGGEIPPQTEGEDMLMRKVGLSPQAKKHFGLFRDPFGEVEEAEGVFVTPDIRYVREAMFQTAKHGGFLAVIGESGAGKSTLRRDLIDRIAREDQPILVIEPYVLGMEANDQQGKTLKAAGIADSIIGRLSPLASPRRSMEAKSRQVHNLLKDSRKAGFAHCLVIEEAHCLPVPTLKHLKRFFELEEGFKKLLSIILVGQPELRLRLDERNPEVREVTQRCEIVGLPPLDARLEEYLAFRFERAGKAPAEVLEPSAYEAIRRKLLAVENRRQREAVSLLYPLAVNNLVTASLNLAAELGSARVTGDVVKEV